MAHLERIPPPQVLEQSVQGPADHIGQENVLQEEASGSSLVLSHDFEMGPPGVIRQS